MRRTDPDLLIAHCSRLGGSWGRRDRVAQRMVEEKGWRLHRAERAIDRALEAGQLRIGKGGTLKFAGTDFSIYEDVRYRLEQSWASTQKLRHASAYVTASSRGARGEGKWIYPDVVMCADPARRDTKDEPRRLHTMEVERAAGFSVESVYQAYEQGRGADYSWVYFVSPGGLTGDEIKTLVKSQKSSSKHWPLLRRVHRAALELEVGLVSMVRPHNVSTWSTIRSAGRRRVDPSGRLALATAIGVDVDAVAGCRDKVGRSRS